MRIYFAAPLFDDMELERNERECRKFELAGHEVYLPQRDAGEAAAGTPRDLLFRRDIIALQECDVVVAYLDGRVPDEGTCFEMGFAYALDKPIYAVRTDSRSFMEGHLNVMLEQSVKACHKSTEEVIRCLKQ